jgi:hypothetical protein
MKPEGDFDWLVRAGRGALVFLCVTACRAPALIGPEPNEPSTEPLATGADQHMDAARREEVRLARHRDLYDPGAKQSIRRCKPQPTNKDPGALDCWVETVNPTAIHDAEMRMHSNRAAYHRRAARDLRETETQACAGVAENARTDSPFARSQVLGVGPLEEPVGENKKPQLVGATIFLQPITDVSVAALQRAMDCYSAHQAVIGYGPITAEGERSPLSEPGSKATVREVSHSYAVEVRADEPFAAQAIWLRAQKLAVSN